MDRPYQVLLDRSYAVCSGYGLRRTKQEEKTEQPPTKRSPENARWRLRALHLFTLYETHSSGAIRREQSLLTAPVRIIVVISVVGDLLPTTPVGLDRPDLTVASGVVDIGYPLTAGSIVRVGVVRGVVGDWLLGSSARIEGIDLVTIGSALARVGYLLAGRRVGRLIVVRGIVGELFLAPSA